MARMSGTSCSGECTVSCGCEGGGVVANALVITVATNRPEKTDFVRMATMMDALIVPFAAVGMAESLTTIADGGSLSASCNELN